MKTLIAYLATVAEYLMHAAMFCLAAFSRDDG